MVSNRLNGKVAIITASTDGIGLGIAQRYLVEGAKVVISSRKQENVDRALETLRSLKGISAGNVEGIVCHVNNEIHRINLVKFTLEKFKNIDILVLNAGINPTSDTRISKSTERLWNVILKTNLVSTAMLINEVIPYMKERKSGKIIVISSASAYNTSVGLGAYSISKTALLALTRLYAGELAESNIYVNCIAPGFIKTKMISFLTDEMVKKGKTHVLLNRFGNTNDITGVAVLLASNESDYITGETISINGGMMSRL